MKKWTVLLMTSLMVLFLAACGGDEEAKDAEKKDEGQNTELSAQDKKKQEEMQKKLDEQMVEDDSTVAVVNDEKILGVDYNLTLSTLQGQMQQMGQDPTTKETSEQMKTQVIDSLVGQALILQEADKKGIKASEEDINEQFEQTKGQFEDEKAFAAALEQSKLDEKELKAQIADSIQFNQYVEKEVPTGEVSEDEIKKAYEEVKTQSEGADQEVPKLEDVKEQIKASIQQQKQQEVLAQHVDDLKEKGKVDIKI
ncbi:SurA N-terminal domain-containing protein [Cytobacillus kochii]|uniref:SurA N-terminal domain-containing protein n=1 Tax=Cytobacillus kochii TaxID=859143 RepID=UPI002E1C398F|nr:SurA N-terminal domain-containing protein [Cytobacillus kochii]